MSCFNEIPNEICLEIYSYIPMCWPMLRKVNRRWRELLRARGEYTSDHYAEWAAGAGYRVNMGAVDCSTIEYYATMWYYNILIHANYSWKIATDFIGYFSMFFNRLDLDASVPLMRACINSIISKCETRDATVTKMLIVFGDVELLEYARMIGFEFHECDLSDARSADIMRKLHEFGCGGLDDVIYSLMRKVQSNYRFGESGAYSDMFNCAIELGAVVTSEDFDIAIRCGCEISMRLMIGAGYELSVEQFQATPSEILNYSLNKKA